MACGSFLQRLGQCAEPSEAIDLISTTVLRWMGAGRPGACQVTAPRFQQASPGRFLEGEGTLWRLVYQGSRLAPVTVPRCTEQLG